MKKKQKKQSKYIFRIKEKKQIQLIQIVKAILVDYLNTTETNYTQRKKDESFGQYNQIKMKVKLQSMELSTWTTKKANIL